MCETDSNAKPVPGQPGLYDLGSLALAARSSPEGLRRWFNRRSWLLELGLLEQGAENAATGQTGQGREPGGPVGEGRPRAKGTPTGPPGASAPSLEYSHNNSPIPSTRGDAEKSEPTGPVLVEETCRLVPCGCRSQWCGSCCKVGGVQIYREVLPVVESFVEMRMVTVTPDRNGTYGGRKFSGPEEAFDVLNPQVSRLIDQVRRKGYPVGRSIKVLEFHSDPDGWPHWHLLIESGDIPHSLLQEIWHRLGGGWVWIGRGPKGRPGFKNRKHAAAYALKYIRKPPKVIPEWVLRRKRPLRRFERSKNFHKGGVKRKSPGEAGKKCFHCNTVLERKPGVKDCRQPREWCPKCEHVMEPKRRRRRNWSTGYRVSQCCSKTVIMRIRREHRLIGTKETRKYLATSDYNVGDILTLCNLPPRECLPDGPLEFPEEQLANAFLAQVAGREDRYEFEEPEWSPFWEPPG